MRGTLVQARVTKCNTGNSALKRNAITPPRVRFPLTAHTRAQEEFLSNSNALLENNEQFCSVLFG